MRTLSFLLTCLLGPFAVTPHALAASPGAEPTASQALHRLFDDE